MSWKDADYSVKTRSLMVHHLQYSDKLKKCKFKFEFVDAGQLENTFHYSYDRYMQDINIGKDENSNGVLKFWHLKIHSFKPTIPNKHIQFTSYSNTGMLFRSNGLVYLCDEEYNGNNYGPNKHRIFTEEFLY